MKTIGWYLEYEYKKTNKKNARIYYFSTFLGCLNRDIKIQELDVIASDVINGNFEHYRKKKIRIVFKYSY